MSPDVSNPAAREIDYLTLYDVYLEQIEALVEGGVDAVLIETVFDTLNAKVPSTPRWRLSAVAANACP